LGLAVGDANGYSGQYFQLWLYGLEANPKTFLKKKKNYAHASKNRNFFSPLQRKMAKHASFRPKINRI
jgi:hypothetical protein